MGVQCILLSCGPGGQRKSPGQGIVKCLDIKAVGTCLWRHVEVFRDDEHLPCLGKLPGEGGISCLQRWAVVSTHTAGSSVLAAPCEDVRLCA